MQRLAGEVARDGVLGGCGVRCDWRWRDAGLLSEAEGVRPGLIPETAMVET